MAILAGDALLTLAFQVLGGMDSIPAEAKARIVLELATAAGTAEGMIGGQVADLEGEGQPPTPELLESIHRAKTGALLRASLRMGAIYAGADKAQYAALSCYGEHAGLAFQIVDDILDVEETSEALGKTAGKDAQQKKITFPAVYGIEEARQMAARECAAAHQALGPLAGRAQRLHELADLIVARKS
jgi:geranylgeranyl diphosphate synthase type II